MPKESVNVYLKVKYSRKYKAYYLIFGRVLSIGNAVSPPSFWMIVFCCVLPPLSVGSVGLLLGFGSVDYLPGRLLVSAALQFLVCIPNMNTIV